jgi:hypothetical protein
MKKLVILLLLSCSAFSQTVKLSGAWLPLNVKWEHAPPQINPRLETGATMVLYFGEHGEFALVECVVNREPGRYTTLSRGDGQIVSLGKWDGHLPGTVKYRLVSRTVAIEGEKLPGPWHEEKLVPTKKGYLMFHGQLYHHVDDLGTSVRELLQGTPEATKQ